MPNRLKGPRTFSVSQDSKLKPITTRSSTRSRVLTGNSGYAAAEFNFPLQNFPLPLIISEPNEDTSSWQ
jgi:hypothetical protein